jgi:adenylate kinase
VNLLLLGPQGSGKGTQARRIAAAYAVEHVETGRILRESIAAGTELGRRVEPIVTAGGLVPDDLMIELIRERLASLDDGFVLDGFPRTLAQAAALDAMFAEIERRLDAVLFFQLPDAVARERLIGRARDVGRADDTPEAIDRRLALYHEQTEPVVEHYRATGRLVPLHAGRSVEQVFAEIDGALAEAARR